MSINADDSRYRLDDLQTDGYQILQKPADFCFGTDAVLLADFASKRIKKNGRVMDLCTGNGIVPLLICSRRKDVRIHAVEINEETAELAQYNIELNSLTDRVNVTACDLKNLPAQMNGSFDAVSVNPPYIPPGKGLISDKIKITEARHEVSAELEDIIRTASVLLTDKGKFFMVHRAHRAAEAVSLMKKHRLEPKELRFVHSNANSKANLMLIAGAKNAGVWMDIHPPLILYRDDGSCTAELNTIYRRDKT